MKLKEIKEIIEDTMNEKLVSRPTCGKEQRKFLDEVEMMTDLTDSELSLVSFDYFESDIDKVIRGE